jgi:demethylmenaquinone methyltransferase/2-methoxy-6-polyprenyl-1,4-benzoquinol methylase
MPFDDGTFDLVMATTVIHAIDPRDRGGVVAEMHRVTAPGGNVMIIDPHAGPLDGIRSRLARFLDTAIEWIAGGDHYRNYRQFLASGGLPALVAGLGMEVTELTLHSSDTFGAYLIPRDR